MQIPISKNSIQPKCGSGIGFQFHAPGTKEYILSPPKNWGVKTHIFNQKSQIPGRFKKSILAFKDTAVQL